MPKEPTHIRTCPTCHQPTLITIHLGLRYTLDPTPLTPAHQALTWLNHQHTYWLRATRTETWITPQMPSPNAWHDLAPLITTSAPNPRCILKGHTCPASTANTAATKPNASSPNGSKLEDGLLHSLLAQAGQAPTSPACQDSTSKSSPDETDYPF